MMFDCFSPSLLATPEGLLHKERAAEMETPPRHTQDHPMRGVRPNIVQSIRAYRVHDLLAAAQFLFPAHFGKNFDALYDCMTDPLHKCGPQPGFIVVLEQIPATVKFDKEAREQLLDIFRDAADYWAERKIPFRCFYSFL